jgi:hypothetical protein
MSDNDFQDLPMPPGPPRLTRGNPIRGNNNNDTPSTISINNDTPSTISINESELDTDDDLDFGQQSRPTTPFRGGRRLRKTHRRKSNKRRKTHSRKSNKRRKTNKRKSNRRR